MPAPNAIQIAQRFRQQLANREAQAQQRMANIYVRIISSLSDQISQLTEQIAAQDEPSIGKIVRSARYRAIVKQLEDEIGRIAPLIINEVDLIRSDALQASVNDSLDLILASLPENIPPEILQVVRASFTRLPIEALQAAAGLVGDDSPLIEKITDSYGEAVAEQVSLHLLDGIGKGQNPRTIARLLNKNLENAAGTGLTWAMSTVRTAQVKSYQLGNHATYQANSHLVPSWVWHSALDDRTCMSCISQHGSIHPITETLNDHHQGRCAAIPQAISLRDLGLNVPERRPPVQTGEQWFNRQSKAVQRQMMGPASFRAYEDNAIGLEDFSKPYQDDVYGELLREASLKDMLGGQAKEYYAASS